MRDFNGHSPSPSVGNMGASRKRLGGYLVEAGLLTPAQIDVALNDQKLTGMRFGEILAARGWVKQQTIEYLMKKVVLPEQQQIARLDQTRKTTLRQDRTVLQRELADPHSAAGARSGSLSPSSATAEPSKQAHRREVPISKPLPPVNSSDNDVSWVG